MLQQTQVDAIKLYKLGNYVRA